MSSDRDRLIAFVAQSPKLCAAHDREGWLDLFAADGQVNDPVGSKPHEGRRELANFYDTFIAPNQLRFEVAHDVTCAMSVMRDLAIHTVMANGAQLSVPMHLRYDLVEEQGRLKIRRLYAHWELPQMLAQQMGSLPGLLASLELTPRMLRYQGVAGVVGFMRALGGTGRAGKATASTFLAALAAGNATAAAAFLADGAVIEAPFGRPATLPELVANARGLSWEKLIGAGDYSSATVRVGERRGVAVFHFADAPSAISRVLWFI